MHGYAAVEGSGFGDVSECNGIIENAVASEPVTEREEIAVSEPQDAQLKQVVCNTDDSRSFNDEQDAETRKPVVEETVAEVDSCETRTNANCPTENARDFSIPESPERTESNSATNTGPAVEKTAVSRTALDSNNAAPAKTSWAGLFRNSAPVPAASPSSAHGAVNGHKLQKELASKNAARLGTNNLRDHDLSAGPSTISKPAATAVSKSEKNVRCVSVDEDPDARRLAGMMHGLIVCLRAAANR